MGIERILKNFGELVLIGAFAFSNPQYADAKVTQIYKRWFGNDTIIRIYDNQIKEGYLYPVYKCKKCSKTHSDGKRVIVSGLFETKSGKIVDYSKDVDYDKINGSKEKPNPQNRDSVPLPLPPKP